MRYESLCLVLLAVLNSTSALLTLEKLRCDYFVFVMEAAMTEVMRMVPA